MLECDCLLCGSLLDRGGRVEIGSGFALAADAAPLAPGHLMLHTLEHKPSFSNLSQERLAAAEGTLRELTLRNARAGRDTLIFEHGTDGTSKGAGCVDHAHIHILPVPGLTGAEPIDLLPTGLAIPAEEIAFAQLPQLQGSNYFWLAGARVSPLIFIPKNPQRQELRHVIASILGRTDYFTWDIYDLDQARQTTEDLRSRFGVA